MRKPLDKSTEKALKLKFKPTIEGLVLTFDKNLLESNLSANGRLVFAGLVADLSKDLIVSDVIKYRQTNGFYGYYHKYTKSKRNLIEDLGISESSFYRAINELEEKKWITTGYNQHKNGSNSTAYYLLHQTIDLNEKGRVLMTSEMLKRQYVRTKQKSKTLSANSKIILALLAQESRKSFKREISTTASEISKDHNIPLSTIYYLITKFVNCSALTRNKEQDKLVLVLLDEYIQHQIKVNELSSGTHPKKTESQIKEKIIPDEMPRFIAEYMEK